MEDLASKSVTWRVPTRETMRTRSNGRQRVKSALATRDQPTWYNCKQLRPAVEKQGKKKRIKSAPSVIFSDSRRSSYSCYTLPDSQVQSINASTAGEEIVTEQGREVLRRRAKEVLSPILDTKYQNFDVSDLKFVKKSRAASATSLGSGKYSDAATKIIAPQQTNARRRPFFLSGVPSRSYRRPSIQMNMDILSESGTCASMDNIKRRQSVPNLPSQIGTSHFSGSKYFTRSEKLSSTASSTAPATIASNDEPLVVHAARGPEPAYMERDWNSDLLSRYALHRPWLPRYVTTRYFPKHLNMQDIHCRNPYIVPGCILHKSSVS
ncbi:uncharacterized protein LOC144744261 [Ciona intestinalis]